MKKTLPRLSEYNNRFLINIPKKEVSKRISLVNFFTNFITQQLNISHFVPAVMKDGVWVVLDKPSKNMWDKFINYEMGSFDDSYNYCFEYQTALDNVVFKGDYKIEYDNGYWITLKSYTKLFLKDFTIEDIIPYNLEITDATSDKFKL